MEENMDKHDKSIMANKGFEDNQAKFINRMNRKQRQVEAKLKQNELERLEKMDIKRERQRLVQEENKKRIEFQKQSMNYWKLQVLDKHTRIDEQTQRLNDHKNQFIECSRIANELRL